MENTTSSAALQQKEDEIQNEFDLKKADLELRKRELEARLRVERRGIWLPAIAGLMTAVFGAGIGAALQGYSNVHLERQKFESSLIQKALENPDRSAAAKSLSFLVEIGLIQNLNSERIKVYTDKPETLPLYFHRGITSGLITVKRAKEILSRLGHYFGEIDDIVSIQFANSVKDFQKREGLSSVDGELGPETALKLLSIEREYR